MFRFGKRSLLPLRSSVPRPSRPQLEELESRITPYSVSGNAWTHPELLSLSSAPDGTVWASGGNTSNLFSSLNGSFSSTADWQHQILLAAQSWAEQANINFTVVSDNGQTIGQGSYQQGDPNHGDVRFGGYNFGTGTQPVAQAFMPPPANNYDIAGEIKFNTGKYFTTGTTYDLFTVTAHELGHALGLNHSIYSRAVMYSTYVSAMTALYSDDINGIRAIYGARPNDTYDAAASNGTFATASDITSTISTSTYTATLTGLDITTQSDVDYYKFSAPTGTASTLQVVVQSQGLSLLMPTVTVYASDQSTILGSASDTGYAGSTLTIPISNVTAGQQFYVKVTGNEASAFGTGKYAMTLNFSTGANPTVPLPNTQVANGNPLHGSGGIAVEPGQEDHDDYPDSSEGTDAPAATVSTAQKTASVADSLAVQAVARPAVAGAPAAVSPVATVAAVRADGVVQASLVLTTATTPTILPSVIAVPATPTVSLPATVAEHTTGRTPVALSSGGEVSTGDVGSDDTPVPGSPAPDSAAPADQVPQKTPATPEQKEQETPPTAALDAYFADEDTSTGQEVRTVETADRGPALLASAGLVLGWIGLWRRDGATLQPSAPRARRSQRSTHPAGKP
ncbi:MAG: matrixin family metalloprotease [Planctomycetes bacterium]|nr:matrixin family metalloprotease [Planctomycetota bacterium]